MFNDEGPVDYMLRAGKPICVFLEAFSLQRRFSEVKVVHEGSYSEITFMADHLVPPGFRVSISFKLVYSKRMRCWWLYYFNVEVLESIPLVDFIKEIEAKEMEYLYLGDTSATIAVLDAERFLGHHGYDLKENGSPMMMSTAHDVANFFRDYNSLCKWFQCAVVFPDIP